jgi:hypothetical protein
MEVSRRLSALLDPKMKRWMSNDVGHSCRLVVSNQTKTASGVNVPESHT